MKIKKLLLIGLIPVLFFVFSCSFFPAMSDSDLDSAVSDAELIQAMIPGLEAGLAVFKTPEGTKTIDTTNAPNMPATPDDMWASPTYSQGDYARYPETGYLTDFYGTEGNQAYMLLKQATDGWGDYQVILYIFPTLSPSVNYTMEKYRVATDSWDLVDKTGSKNAVAFESIQTSYFDGRTEDRTVKWTRYVDDKVYPATDFTNFDDPAALEDPSNLTIDTVVEPDKTAASADDGQYSSYTQSYIPTSINSGSIVTTAKEFYSEPSDGNKYSKSYVFNDLSQIVKTTTKTIRVYKEDTTGNKYIAAKTVGNFSWRSYSWATTTTEEIAVTVNTDSTVSYTSTVAKTTTGDFKSTTTTGITLDETAADSNSFTGTETITNNAGTKTTYNVTLNATDGLKISNSDGTDITYELNSIQNNPLIEIILSNGSSFSGKLAGKILKGTYKKNGKAADITLSTSFLNLTSGSNTILR